MKVVNIFAMMLLVVCFVSVGCKKEGSSVPIPTENGDVENQGDTDEHPEGTDADGNPVSEEEAAPAKEAEEAAPAKEAEEAAPAKEEEAAPAKEEAKKE
ncbi:MAG: hypothetical protein OSB47_05285 [Pirellulaceae bacterium]|nr:hypothetical protein [Pirellulaceae bacterium]